MKIDYPAQHQQIVNDLLEGKFLLYTDFQKFQSLKDNDNFYTDFFKKSFGYELRIRNEFAYLISDKTDEKISRNFTIFLAILCYEINQKTTDFKNRIENDIFSYQETENYLKSKNFEEVVNEIGIDNLSSFLRTLAKRNIIEFMSKNEDNFKFTRAINLFFEFAIDLSKQEAENKNEP
ncbi:MAG: hypothetical protein EAZ44_02025 [Cytophagia bacterium]|nr:MAG: hypothetical protein EAZ44_02025 [Cytophagia bacterium]